MMKWEVELQDEFYKEFLIMELNLQDEILAKSILLEEYGSHLGRPHVDTLKSSYYSNMK